MFEDNKGIRLPADMRRELGIQTAELQDRPRPRPRERTVQVFRTGQAHGPAAAILRLDPAEAARTPVGTRLELRTAAATGELASASVVLVDTAPVAFCGQVEVVLEWPDPSGRWPAGTSLTTALPASGTNTVPTVPRSAVLDGAQGPFVYAANGEHFVRTPIRIGAADDTQVEVTEGLYAGDVVVSQGADALWTIELCALKGGTPCCPVPLKKGRD